MTIRLNVVICSISSAKWGEICYTIEEEKTRKGAEHMRDFGPKRKPGLLVVLVVVVLAVAAGVAAALAINASGGGGKTPVSSAPLVAGSQPPQHSLPASFPQVQSVQPPAPQVVSSSQPEPPLESQSSSSEPESVYEPEESGPLAFVEGTPKVVQTSGKTVTVLFQTNTGATVNAIVSTSDAAPSIAGFYDYFNRGQANEAYVGKHSVYKVGNTGVSQSFEIPDTTKTYYLIVNAVEDETNVWQPTTQVVLLYAPGQT